MLQYGRESAHVELNELEGEVRLFDLLVTDVTCPGISCCCSVIGVRAAIADAVIGKGVDVIAIEPSPLCPITITNELCGKGR